MLDIRTLYLTEKGRDILMSQISTLLRTSALLFYVSIIAYVSMYILLCIAIFLYSLCLTGSCVETHLYLCVSTCSSKVIFTKDSTRKI